MARIVSQALAGFFATPPSVTEKIASHLAARPGSRYAFFDPCAGEGVALADLGRALFPASPGKSLRAYSDEFRFYGVEMEPERFEKLKRNWENAFGYGSGTVNVRNSDAFRMHITQGEFAPGASLLWLNPPYDTDREFGRLEEKFLRKFGSTLVENGVLVYLVPGYVLETSAETLAREFYEVSVFRFPADEYPTYRQVAFFGRRRAVPLPGPDETLLSYLREGAKNPDRFPELETAPSPTYYLPLGATYQRERDPQPIQVPGGFEVFDAIPFDFERVAKGVRPWFTSDRSGKTVPLLRYWPDPKKDGTERTFPTALAPKPAHIAAGVAAGIFNGERVSPDDPTSGAPDLLVKGVFTREFEVESEKTNSDGQKIAEVRVEVPRLVLTVLDLRSATLHRLVSSVEVTGTRDPGKMTIGDLLTLYGRNLLGILRAHCPVIYDPENPSNRFPLAATSRTPFEAQATAARALVGLLGGPDLSLSERKGKAAALLGEIGSGKTTVAELVALTVRSKKNLVVAPPHLMKSWVDQTRAISPDSDTVVIESIDDIRALRARQSDRPVFAILSREIAKLGSAAEAVGPLTPRALGGACPGCGVPIPEGDLAGKRARCSTKRLEPIGPSAKALLNLAVAVARGMPSDPIVGAILSGRRVLAKWLEKVREIDARRTAEESRNSARTFFESLRDSEKIGSILETLGERYLETANGKVFDAIVALFAAIRRPALLRNYVERMYVATGFEDADGYSGNGRSIREAVRSLARLLPAGPERDELSGRLAEIDFPKPSYVYYGAKNDADAWRGFSPEKTDLTYGERVEILPDGTRKVFGLKAGDPGLYGKALEALYATGGWRETGACGEFLYAATPAPRRFPLATYIARYAPDCFDFLFIDECFPGETLVRTETGPKPIRDIVPGERVFSRTENGEIVLRKVVRRFEKRPTRGLVRVEFPNGHVDCTPEHRFWTPSGYVPASRLNAGDEFYQFGEGIVPVLDTYEREETAEVVYDLEVEETHCYFAGDILVHNCHEYGDKNSGQSRAAYRLTELGKPTVVLTGSLMNGYAKSLFPLFWALFPWFREEFAPTQLGLFVTRYGYRKVVVKEIDPAEGKVVEWGTRSDRVVRTETPSGDAPGILPLFILKMLRSCVVMHTEDLGVNLPPRRDYLELIEPDEDQLRAHQGLVDALVSQIRSDRFNPEKAGKLYGAMAEISSHLDLATADLGNSPGGNYEIRYPDSVGGAVVYSAPPIGPASRLLPKELALVDRIRREKAEGRPVLVLVRHVPLYGRLARILKEAGLKGTVLEASKVPTGKREAWIDAQVIAKGVDFLLANPTTVQTGLNNLTYFPTQVWMENPACHPHVFRQTCGRAHRIGQTRETRIFFFAYAAPSQKKSHSLLLHKVAVAASTDGFDASSAFALAGVGEAATFTSYSVGRELYRLLSGEG